MPSTHHQASHKNLHRVMAAGLLLAVSAIPAPAMASDSRDVVRHKGNGVVVSTFGSCVRTKWDSPSDPCAPPAAEKPKKVAKKQRPKARQMATEQRTIYFEFNRAAVTPDGQEKLGSLSSVLKADDSVRSARIVGYADRIGTPEYNEQLSMTRAKNVESYLHQQGYLKTSAETRWLGETVPVTQCEEGMKRQELIACLAKDRRVEVEIEYLPAK